MTVCAGFFHSVRSLGRRAAAQACKQWWQRRQASVFIYLLLITSFTTCAKGTRVLVIDVEHTTVNRVICQEKGSARRMSCRVGAVWQLHACRSTTLVPVPVVDSSRIYLEKVKVERGSALKRERERPAGFAL